MEAFAEVWVKSSWALLSLCFSAFREEPVLCFHPRNVSGCRVCSPNLPSNAEEGIEPKSEPCAGFAGRFGEGRAADLAVYLIS